MNERKIIAFVLGPIGSAILSFITLPILAWMFSPSDIGRLTLLQVAISFSFVLCGLALEQAYVREFYEHKNNAALLKTTLLPGLLLTLAIILILFVFGLDASQLLFGIQNSALTLLVYICVGLNFITTYSALTLRMREEAFVYSLISLVNKAIFLFLILVLYVFKFNKNFIALISLNALSIATSFFLAIWLTKGAWAAALRAPFLRDELLGFFKFSTPLIFGGLAYWGLTTVDRISIREWASFEQLGIFSVAVGFAGVASLFQSIFTTIWTPFIYRWNTEGLDTEKLNQVVEHVLAAVVLIYSLVGAFSWIVSFLLPEKYSIVSYILPACMGAPLLYMLSETTVVGVHLTRKTFYAMLAPLFALIFNLVLNYCLVPQHGAAGATAATSIAFFVFLFVRTEFSAILWQPLPRKKIYFFAFLCSGMSSIQAIFYNVLGGYCFFAWGIVFFIALIAFNTTIQTAIRFVSERYKVFKARG